MFGDSEWGYCRGCKCLVVIRPVPHADAGCLEPHNYETHYAARALCGQTGRLPDPLPSDGVIKELQRKDLAVMRYVNDMPNRDPREENR